jgi:hypothetical protein
MHKVINRLKHTSSIDSSGSGNECIDLDKLYIKRLGIDTDKVENLDEPIISIRMEECEEIVLESSLSLTELGCSTHRINDNSLETRRYTTIVTTSITTLELERRSREEINQDSIIDTKTPKEIIDIPICHLGNLDEDIFWKYLSIAKLLGPPLCCKHDITILCSKLIEHDMIMVNFV